MTYKTIAITSRSITIELINDHIYKTHLPYNLYLNGTMYGEGLRENVFSIFNLKPDTSYEIEVRSMGEDQGYMTSVHTIKEYVRLDVKRFGAKGDGITVDTMAIQGAIMACPTDGTVFISKGTYYCGPIFLKSDMTLEFEEGATLLGHVDRQIYPILPGYTMTTDEKDEYYIGTWEGNPLDQYASLITGIDVKNVAIIGKGIIDGNAQNSDWWVNPKIKRGAWRPRTIFLKGCENIMLQGLTVRNSPSWTIHPYLSSYLRFFDLKIHNHKESPNTDGLDPESCYDVQIIGVDFSVGDDCIAIKSGKLYMGKKLKTPSSKLIIRNCRMRHGHGAVVIGSEMSGGVNDLHVSQCIFEKTDRGLRIKTRRGRGEDGIIDNIHFEKIQMIQVLTPFVMNMYYFCDPDGKTEYVWSKECLPVDEGTPYLGKFIFKDIDCRDSEVACAFFAGLPEQPIGEIRMEDIFVRFKTEAKPGFPAMMSHLDPMRKKGIVADFVQKLILKNVWIDGYEGEKFTLNHIDKIEDLSDDKEGI